MCKPDLRSVSEQPAMDRWGSSSQLLGSWTTLAPALPVPRGPAYNKYVQLTLFHFVTRLNSTIFYSTIYIDLTRLPSKQQLRSLRTRKPLAYRESTCTNLCVYCPYEIIVYSVPKHINTTRMHKISRQFIPHIYGPLGKRMLSNIQPTRPFH